MIHIPAILSADRLAEVNGRIADSEWVCGRQTAGHQSALVKNNQQLDEEDKGGLAAAAIILDVLATHPIFVSAALPSKISPPLFNRYDIGEAYGDHIDGAIRPLGSGRMRTDLSATLFLNQPSSYEGGELVITDSRGVHEIKLPAGDLILYDSGSIHHVAPVRQGSRRASFFWVQSLVRLADQRAILFDLDTVIQELTSDGAQKDHILALTAQYHTLLRLWTDV